MTPDALAGRLREAIDGKMAVRVYCGRERAFMVGTEFPDGGSLYPVTRARAREDGLVEASDGYDEWLIDPAEVRGVSMYARKYPEWEKRDGGNFI